MCENELLSRGKYWHFPLLISFTHVKMMTFFGVMLKVKHSFLGSVVV